MKFLILLNLVFIVSLSSVSTQAQDVNYWDAFQAKYDAGIYPVKADLAGWTSGRCVTVYEPTKLRNGLLYVGDILGNYTLAVFSAGQPADKYDHMTNEQLDGFKATLESMVELGKFYQQETADTSSLEMATVINANSGFYNARKTSDGWVVNYSNKKHELQLACSFVTKQPNP